MDHATTRWAGRGYYAELLGAGVRIWEYRETMLHAKTLAADGTWAWIGTIFIRDLAHSLEITLETFARRPRWERVREKVVRTVAALL